jgi:uncharacterized protein (UPF0332 family)
VKPETGAFLQKAKDFPARAPALLAQGFTDDAGRAAYLAGFHAAQALIFETQGRPPKSHGGVQSAFALLVRNEPVIDRDLRSFLGRTYNLKAVADYETGPGSKVSVTQATEAITAATRFVAAIVGLIPVTPSPSSRTPKAEP